MKNETRWLENYEQLKLFIQEHGHLPNKKKVENRGLLNWWKYNQKLIRRGALDEERCQMLQRLSDMRTSIAPRSECYWVAIAVLSHSYSSSCCLYSSFCRLKSSFIGIFTHLRFTAIFSLLPPVCVSVNVSLPTYDSVAVRSSLP